MLDYRNLLNKAQYRAVTLGDGPALISAGAGTGKTRTIVYRLAWLVEHGVAPQSILLLTFTRKAAHEMLRRADSLLGEQCRGVAGGTFHSFAARSLRRFPPQWLEKDFSVLDQSDAQSCVLACKHDLEIGKGDKSFPKAASLLGIFSRARNKEESLATVIKKDSPHLVCYTKDLEKIMELYQERKRSMGLFDYDDLLFELEEVLKTNEKAQETFHSLYRYLLIDEYQDTNLVQARLAKLIAGERASVMVVGDEAQSIYSFRGATIQNILTFPSLFAGTEIVRLECNYRSTSYILDAANRIMGGAIESYGKKLFTHREGGEHVKIIDCASNTTEAEIVAKRVKELLQIYPAEEIAVLFRSGYESFLLELALARLGILFKKYGGVKYIEAAHIKDIIAYLRYAQNGADIFSFQRMASFFKGIGKKTSEKILQALLTENQKQLANFQKKHPQLFAELAFIEELRQSSVTPAEKLYAVCTRVSSFFQERYPEDYPSRIASLSELPTMAYGYDDLDDFISDFLLESPEEGERDTEPRVVLSTIHSAKGLEWKAVLLINVSEGHLPSRYANSSASALEEERRLMYVACTRAKDILEIYTTSIFYSGTQYYDYADKSIFISDLEYKLVEMYKETRGLEVRFLSGGKGQADSYVPERAENARAKESYPEEHQTREESLDDKRWQIDSRKLRDKSAVESFASAILAGTKAEKTDAVLSQERKIEPRTPEEQERQAKTSCFAQHSIKGGGRKKKAAESNASSRAEEPISSVQEKQETLPEEAIALAWKEASAKRALEEVEEIDLRADNPFELLGVEAEEEPTESAKEISLAWQQAREQASIEEAKADAEEQQVAASAEEIALAWKRARAKKVAEEAKVAAEEQSAVVSAEDNAQTNAFSGKQRRAKKAAEDAKANAEAQPAVVSAGDNAQTNALSEKQRRAKKPAGDAKTEAKTQPAVVSAGDNAFSGKQGQLAVEQPQGEQTSVEAKALPKKATKKKATKTAQNVAESPSGGATVNASAVIADIASGKITSCFHKQFGKGKIVGVKADILRVRFSSGPVRTIVASFLTVEK